MSEKDPFTRAAEILYTALIDEPIIAGLVVVKSRIAHLQDVPKTRWYYAPPAELPVMVLAPSGCEMDVLETTHTARFEQAFTLTYATGDERIIPRLNRLKWGTAKAILRLKHRRDAPDWFTVARITSGDEEVADERSDGIKGWVTAIEIVVRMDVPHDQILAQGA